MTSKERFFATLNHQPADRVPVMPYIGNWAAHLGGYKLGEYETSGKAMADAQYRAWQLHGLDIVNPQSDNYYIAEGLGVKTQIYEDATPGVISRPVNTLDDVAKLHVPDPYTEGRMPVYLEAIERLADKIGDRVVVRCPGTGPFSLAGHVFGVEKLIEQICLADVEEDEEAQEKLEQLMTVCTQALIEFDIACIKKGGTMIMNGDSLASLNMTSPSIYKKYCFKYEKMLFDALAPYKKDYQFAGFLHVCGKNDLVADQMMQTGADILEVDYACNLERYKEISTKRNVCIVGTLNPAGTLMNGTPEEVYHDCMTVLNTAAQDGFFLLGSGCELAICTPLENIKAMIRAAEDFAARG